MSVELERPMGMVLNSGKDGIGAYVSELVEGGNADKSGAIKVGDMLIACGVPGWGGANLTSA